MTTRSAKPLDAERLLPGPGQDYRLIGAPVELVDEIGSTNDELANRLTRSEDVPHLAALLTEHQVAGKGRRDRVWTAPKYSSAVVSFAVRSNAGEQPLPNDSLHWVTPLLALAARTAIRQTTGLPVDIKWPNDLLINGRKIAGILARVVPTGPETLDVVVGIGINANIDADLLPVETATSLRAEIGDDVDRTEILIRVIREFRASVQEFCATGGDPALPRGARPSLVAELREELDTLGRRVLVQMMDPGPDFTGLAHDIDEDGSLLVRCDDGTDKTVAVGDVVHLRPESGSWADVSGTGIA